MDANAETININLTINVNVDGEDLKKALQEVILESMSKAKMVI